MLTRIFPQPLRAGDLVALLSPASPPKNASAVTMGRKSLERLGLRVKLGKHLLRHRGYLAGTDAERAEDLTAVFLDPEVKAVFCTRGGYGTGRLLEHFDVRTAVRHPKAFVGFSDLTLLHLAFQARGLVSFWGPMVSVAPGLNAFAAGCLRRALMSVRPLGLIPNHRKAFHRVIRTGRAEGLITGGTLSLLAASLGTPYEIMTAGRIVFLEDTGEEPYKIDRLLTQLLAAGKLSDAAGIVLGQFTDAAPRQDRRGHSLTLQEVLHDRLRPLRVPAFGGLRLGHLAGQVTLPYHVRAAMDAGSQRLDVLESGVSGRAGRASEDIR